MAYEDFTTYTEVDADNVITVTSTSISFVSLNIFHESRVFKNKGAGHFNQDFSHEFEVTSTVVSGTPATLFWGVSDTVNSRSVLDTSGNTIYFRRSNSGFYLKVIEDGSPVSTDVNGIAIVDGVTYFITITRNYSTHVTVCYVRTGSHTGTLVDTLSVTGTTAVNYDNIYALNTFGGGAAFFLTGSVQNLELNESTAYLISKINGIAIAEISALYGVAIANIKKINGVIIK